MTDPGGLRLYYDYVDPASFLLERRLRILEGVQFSVLTLEPFEVCLPPAPLLDPNDPEWGAHWERMEDVGAAMGIALKRPWIVPWSRKAHELAFQARAMDCFQEIHESLFRAYLLEGLDIGRVDVLVELARECGLDPVETKIALDVDLHMKSVLLKRHSALENGVTTSPTLLRSHRRIEGFPDEDAMGEFFAPSQ